MTPSPQFVASVQANLNYWQGRLQVSTPETTDKLASLEADWQNFVQALKFGFALESAAPLANQLVAQAFRFVERWGYWQEWLPVLERAIALCGKNALELRCQLLDQLGLLNRVVVRLEAAQQAHEQAAALAQALGARPQLARIWYHLALVHRARRELSLVEHYLAQAQAIFKEHGSAAQQAAVESGLGLLALERGDLATAETHYLRSLNLWRATARPSDLAELYLRLGQVSQQRQNPTEALTWYQQAQTIYESGYGNLEQKTELALGLGTLYFELKAWAKAEEVFRQADTPTLRRSLLIWQKASLANNLGNVLLEQGKLEDAEKYLHSALALYRQNPDDVLLGNTLCTLGVVLTQLARPAEAKAAYDEALPLLARHPQHAFAQRLLAKYTAKRAELG